MFATIAIDSNLINGGASAPRPLSKPDAGQALIIFMGEMRRSVIVTGMNWDHISTREIIGRGVYLFVNFRGADDDLRPFREALWYYARHPARRTVLRGGEAERLEAVCELQRLYIRDEAARFPNEGGEDPAIHWRHALLFAARIKDRQEIARALRLSEDDFGELIRIWINDRRHDQPFSYWLSLAEQTAPAP